MAAAALNYNPNKFTIGPGSLWVVTTPSIGAAYTLDASGLPLSTDTAAKHLGHTEAGSTIKLGATFTEENVDEVAVPVSTVTTGSSAEISATLKQTSDMTLLPLLMPGQATTFSATGGTGVTIGQVAPSYLSILLVYATKADPAKFEYVLLYKTFNSAGLTNTVQRTKSGGTPVTFKGLALTSRPLADSVGQIFQQT